MEKIYKYKDKEKKMKVISEKVTIFIDEDNMTPEEFDRGDIWSPDITDKEE